ncbi:MAG: hypothetical protein V2I43_17375 [Parvularcula sp.]|jgi:hypothetical protein|nr:hypothetical protein [Parvularcula sp.]
MTDRLKQIWKGFEGQTGSRLTSVDIERLNVPMRERRIERKMGPEQSLAAGKADDSDAVRAALTALHTDILAKAKGAKRSRRRAGAPEQQFSDLPLQTKLEEHLLADLKFTEARTRRSGTDYVSFARERQDAWKKRRKKFLGIF